MAADETITAVAIAVVRQGDHYLIGQRPAGVALAGYWEFPGGKVRPGETPAAAAARECQEETGLVVQPGKMLADIEHVYPHGTLRLYFLACALADPAATHPCGAFRWVAAGELASYEFPPANWPVLEQLLGPTGPPSE